MHPWCMGRSSIRRSSSSSTLLIATIFRLAPRRLLSVLRVSSSPLLRRPPPRGVALSLWVRRALSGSRFWERFKAVAGGLYP
jgi:hypothetical protein